jgi:glycosyltransferase involved in cell wall biosynthesis
MMKQSNTRMNPFVSIIIPCYNEEKFIESFLKSVLVQDYPKELTEILLIDGMSTDKTRGIIQRIALENPGIRLIDNEKRYVPFTLNIAIKSSHGEIIIRMDAHAEYPDDYISGLVKNLLQLNADNVGAIWINKPGNNTMMALAISRVLSSGFGVGNASYRIGAKEICKVDTVPFGCCKREIFNKIGFFDEELLRNQDDEFNARLLKNGGSIYLIPSIKVVYFTRSTVKAMIKMNYQYGLYKPLVAYKIGKLSTLRQLVPFLFELFLLVTGLGSLFSYFFLLTLVTGSVLYLLVDILFSLKIILESKRFSLFFFLPWTFPALHLSYGWGYFKGLLHLVFRIKKTREISTNR